MIVAMVVPVVIAVVIPVAFLLLVRRLDLYASGNFLTVMICLGGGLAAFVVAYQVNNTLAPLVGYTLVITLVAPVVEEVLKSLILVYYVRRPDFTYFVDGAIYGFAAGVGFAVVENLLYLSKTAGLGGGLTLTIIRAFSTSLMHGSASALMGVALGRLRFGRGFTRLAAVIVGWAAAMSLHITFNRLISTNWGLLTIVLAIVLGLGGVALCMLLIRWGLRQERAWLRETLDPSLGVSTGEAAIVQELAQLDHLLAPVAQRFGVEKRQQVERFLRRQAQLGLKHKVQALTADPKLGQALAAEVQLLRAEVDDLRRAIGVYCMTYVRAILPPEGEPIWQRLDSVLAERAGAEQRSSGPNLWQTLGEKIKEPGDA